MEVKTQEVIRFIDLRFKEQDLIDIKKEIDYIKNKFTNSSYLSDRDNVDIKKLLEFRGILESAIQQLKI